jgi:aminoglycoside phosphotransferase (APT) family kinase protein
MIRYLTAVRSTCEALVRSPDDPAARRGLEQACQILNVLISDANTSPRLEARAAREFNRLLEPLRGADSPQGADDFAAAKTAISQAIRSPNALSAVAAMDFGRRAVEIERQLYLDADQALREESRASQPGGKEQGGGTPSAAAISTYLSGIFERPMEVCAINTVSLGYSKATYLLEIRGSADVPASLVIRMDRPFNFLGTTVIDEYPILNVLHENGVAVPRAYALERTGAVLGQPFVVVSRVYGRNVGSHFSFPPPNPQLCAQMGATLAQIHRLPAERFGPGLRGTGQSGEEQIAAEIDRYHADWTALHAICPTMDAAFRWIKEHAAQAVGPRTLVHGDFSLSNVLVSDDNRISALLDWEFTQLGSPAADIGWFYTAAQRLASWEEFLAAYRSAGGRVPAKPQLDFYVLWGLLRLAVMNFQVATGFEAGRMHDIKHAYAGLLFTRECVRRVGAFLGPLLATA